MCPFFFLSFFAVPGRFSVFIPFGFHTSPLGATFHNGKIEYFCFAQNILFFSGQGLCPCRSPAPMRWSCRARNPRYRVPGAQSFIFLRMSFFSFLAIVFSRFFSFSELFQDLISDEKLIVAVLIKMLSFFSIIPVVSNDL